MVELVEEVFSAAAGEAAAAAMCEFLQSLRVTALEDLQFLELPWLQVGPVRACIGVYGVGSGFVSPWADASGSRAAMSRPPGTPGCC